MKSNALNPRRGLRGVVSSVALFAALGAGFVAAQENDEDENNIVTAVVNAPVVSNGVIGGEPSEINIFLNAPGVKNRLAFDPNNFGHQVPAGGRMEIELGGSFQRNGVDNALAFTPVASNATIILTNGHAQNGIVSAAGGAADQGNYSISDDGNKLITVRPNAGSGNNGLTNARANVIGVKVIHIRPAGNQAGPNRVAPFTNGSAGSVGTSAVRIYNAAGNLVESGSGAVVFRSRLGHQVHLSNEGLISNTEAVETSNFQRVSPGALLFNTVRGTPVSAGAPYAPRFVLFDELANQPDSYIPQKGIAGVGYIVDAKKPTKARLVVDTNGNGVADEGDKQIGTIQLKFKDKGRDKGKREQDNDGAILPSSILTTSGDGVTGANGSILNIPLKIGSFIGEYNLKVGLDDGGEATNTIFVE